VKHKFGSRKLRAALKARKLRDHLENECRQGASEDIAALNQIIAGGPMARNAQSRVKAIAVKWSYGFGAPRQPVSLETEEGRRVQITVRRGKAKSES
jgi:hypothetical protein